MRGTFVEIHVADIHFGAMDPVTQLNIMREQFLNKINALPILDIVSINGDLFDKKFLANDMAITCANIFISELINICISKNTTLILLHGTESHDAHQLNNYYHYLNRPDIDIRIVETMQFINVKGKEILCIPEESNKGREYYMKFFRDRDYDSVYMHGMFVNAIPCFNHEDLDSKKRPVFDISNFWRCNGPVISGHIHIAQCLKRHVYYTGSPIRWTFGEEQPKGFLILLHNLDIQEYAVEMEEIVSFKYDTLHLDQILLSDPNEIIKYLEKLKADGIDYIKLKVDKFNNNIPILREYFRGQDWIKIDNKKAQVVFDADIESKYQNFEFLTDPSIDEYTKFVMYVNSFEGEGFLTIEKLKEILKGE